jgi:predicted O-methyltransferase YrrM
MDCLDVRCNPGEKYWIKDTVHPTLASKNLQDIVRLMFNQISYHGYTMNARIYTYANGALCNDRALKISGFYDEADTGLTLSEWFIKHIRPTFPPDSNLLWFKNGIFGVAKKYVLTRPKSFYQGLLDQITTTRGEVIHYLERSWYFILNLDFIFPSSWLISSKLYMRSIFKTLDIIIAESCHQHSRLVEGSLFFAGGADLTYNEMFLHKQYNLFKLATTADYIMEIGFNAGHSTALMLLANPRAKILHFDAKEHPYVDPCYAFLKSVFGADRFMDLVIGDSRKTVPSYHINQPFNLIHIDGGHTDIVAMSDIINCERFSALNGVVVIDDYNMTNLKALVDKFVRQGTLKDYTANAEAPLFQTYDDSMYHFIGQYASKELTGKQRPF